MVGGGAIVGSLLVVMLTLALLLSVMTTMAGSSRTLYQGSVDGWWFCPYGCQGGGNVGLSQETILRNTLGLKNVVGILLEARSSGGVTRPDDGGANTQNSRRRKAYSALYTYHQFLDYVRLEAGHDLSVVSRAIDVREFVATVVRTFQEEGRLEISVPDDLPVVLADESRLDLALANLISNAVKYSPPDTLITVTAERRGAHVEIAVADQGPGIAAADQPRVFERFSRSEPDRAEGTGLGLYMTRELMRNQGGDVRLSSRPGRGSRFTLVVPVAEEQGG
jgi:light-regulated signal transduction histidine kinase (bacteriophytochrome)